MGEIELTRQKRDEVVLAALREKPRAAKKAVKEPEPEKQQEEVAAESQEQPES